MKIYGLKEFNSDVEILANKIDKNKYTSLYGVPRGGIVVALALSKALGIPLSEKPFSFGKEEKNLFCLVVDDLVDSGETRLRYSDHDFAVLHLKEEAKSLPTYYASKEKQREWIEYFWERGEEGGFEENIARILQAIGEDTNRQGLINTPERYVKTIKYLTKGYKEKPEDILTVFDSESYDQIVLLKDIEIYSLCEHHLLPFWGQAHVAYIPDKKLIGISKLARLVDIYARRLQIQERIGDQVTNDLMNYLQPIGAACIIEASHLCMRMRGIQKQNSVMVTSSLKGAFLKKQSAREELMRLIK